MNNVGACLLGLIMSLWAAHVGLTTNHPVTDAVIDMAKFLNSPSVLIPTFMLYLVDYLVIHDGWNIQRQLTGYLIYHIRKYNVTTALAQSKDLKEHAEIVNEGLVNGLINAFDRAEGSQKDRHNSAIRMLSYAVDEQLVPVMQGLHFSIETAVSTCKNIQDDRLVDRVPDLISDLYLHVTEVENSLNCKVEEAIKTSWAAANNVRSDLERMKAKIVTQAYMGEGVMLLKEYMDREILDMKTWHLAAIKDEVEVGIGRVHAELREVKELLKANIIRDHKDSSLSQ